MPVFADIGKFVGAKVAGVIITIATLAGGYWCYEHWDKVEAFGAVVRQILIWIVIVAALPWSSYLFMKPLLAFQGSLNSERTAAMTSIAVIGAYCIVDLILAFWLGDWEGANGFSWFMLVLGLAAAGAYNFVICESLARQADR